MIPEVNDGDFVIASPAAEPVSGKKVVIFFRNGSQPLIKRLLALPADPEGHLVFATLNPFRVHRCSMSEVDRVHAIVGVYTPEQHDEAVELHRAAEARASGGPDFYVDVRGDCMRASP